MHNNFTSFPTIHPESFLSQHSFLPSSTYEGATQTMPTKSKQEKIQSAITLHYYEVFTGRYDELNRPINNWLMTEDQSVAEANLESRMIDLDDLYEAECVGLDYPYRDKVIRTEIGCVEWQRTDKVDFVGNDASYEQFDYIW